VGYESARGVPTKTQKGPRDSPKGAQGGPKGGKLQKGNTNEDFERSAETPWALRGPPQQHPPGLRPPPRWRNGPEDAGGHWRGPLDAFTTFNHIQSNPDNKSLNGRCAHVSEKIRHLVFESTSGPFRPGPCVAAGSCSARGPRGRRGLPLLAARRRRGGGELDADETATTSTRLGITLIAVPNTSDSHQRSPTSGPRCDSSHTPSREGSSHTPSRWARGGVAAVGAEGAAGAAEAGACRGGRCRRRRRPHICRRPTAPRRSRRRRRAKGDHGDDGGSGDDGDDDDGDDDGDGNDHDDDDDDSDNSGDGGDDDGDDTRWRMIRVPSETYRPQRCIKVVL